MKRIALGIQYDGAAWHGWQTQPSGHTVQDQLETALKKFSLEDVSTTCAGRTDTGVHAIEQVVHFDTPVEREPFSWVRGVNAFLPPSIAVRWACEVQDAEGEAFHARFHAISRTYYYLVHNHAVRSPLVADKAGWVFRPIDIDAMRAAAQTLIGTHDFSAFRAAECQAKSPIKSMHEIDIQKRGDFVIFKFCANAFLHHMVRNIVGSLVVIGANKYPATWMKDVLEGRDRSRGAPTFMPDGLYLAKIEYDPKWNLPQESIQLPWLL